MRIKEVDPFLLRIPNRKPYSLEHRAHQLAAVEIRTDEGLSGFGYSLILGGAGAEAVHSYLDLVLKPLLLGQDAAVEPLWNRMFRADRGVRRVGLAGYAISALDIALWDLAGKAAGKPLARLWGAARDSVPAYGSGGWAAYSVADLAAEAQSYARLGCRHYKMKIHHPDPAENRRRVQAVQSAVGGAMRIMADANQRFEPEDAILQARALEDLDLVWLEEPVLADDLAGCADVARRTRIPIATGENSYTRYEFAELLAKGAAAVLMPDVCRANGFSETLRIGRLAAEHGAEMSPHVVHELSLHVAAALENAPFVELMDWAPPDLFEGMPECRDGRFHVPDRPGHGISLREGARRAYAP